GGGRAQPGRPAEGARQGRPAQGAPLAEARCWLKRCARYRPVARLSSARVVPGEHVVAEVAARPAQHGVRVVRTVLRVVVLDEQVRTLDPVVVAVPRPHRAGPGEVQLAFAQPGGL